jgi:hypothetical protein
MSVGKDVLLSSNKTVLDCGLVRCALVWEEGNTPTVLLDALQNEPSTATLKAVIGYANFLYHDTPNIDVTGKALEVIESNPSLDIDGTLLPHC